MEHDKNNNQGWSSDLETYAESLLERSENPGLGPSSGEDVKMADKRYTDTFDGQTVVIDSTNWRHSNIVKGQIAVSYVLYALMGAADQTIGTIIPVLQEDYKIGDVETSYIFLASITGYISMGLFYGTLQSYIGLRGIVVSACLGMAIAEVVFSFAPPYFLLIIFTVVHGFGLGALDAACNAWMGTLVESNQLLGLLHGFYGIGCAISPVLISYLLKREHNPWTWNNYYLVLSVFAALSFFASLYFFRYESAAKYKYLLNQTLTDAAVNGHHTDDVELDNFKIGDEDDVSETPVDSASMVSTRESANLAETLKSKLVWTFAIALLLYVGGETAFGSWLVTYLTRIKEYEFRTASSVASAFWLGLTSGRMVGGFVTVHAFPNELTANFTYCIISTIGYAIFVGLTWTSWRLILYPVVFVTGLAVGPIFPTTITSTMGILHPKYHSSGIGLICAFGGGGAAAFPFLVGLVAESSAGLGVYPTIITVVYIVLSSMWAGIFFRYNSTYQRVST